MLKSFNASLNGLSVVGTNVVGLRFRPYNKPWNGKVEAEIKTIDGKVTTVNEMTTETGAKMIFVKNIDEAAGKWLNLSTFTGTVGTEIFNNLKAPAEAKATADAARKEAEEKKAAEKAAAKAAAPAPKAKAKAPKAPKAAAIPTGMVQIKIGKATITTDAATAMQMLAAMSR